MYGIMTKKKKSHVSPKRTGEPEKKIPDGHKEDEMTGEIIPMTDKELRLESLKSSLTGLYRQTFKLE